MKQLLYARYCAEGSVMNQMYSITSWRLDYRKKRWKPWLGGDIGQEPVTV